jgi:hypothetical protein
MSNIRSAIRLAKCRKGEAVAKTKRGSYWLACDRIKIRDFGGDGIGQSAADKKHHLELRHYRDDTVSTKIIGHYWHQNGAGNDRIIDADVLLDCETVEDVICKLKGMSVGGNHAYSDMFESDLTDALTGLGLAESAPAPDETTVA